jgi:glucose/arabinose dehydrogenase
MASLRRLVVRSLFFAGRRPFWPPCNWEVPIAVNRHETQLTGFVVNDDSVWGRPAGVAVTRDGALLVSDDANGTIVRVARGNP